MKTFFHFILFFMPWLMVYALAESNTLQQRRGSAL